MDSRFFLFDLECTVSSGMATYWKPNKHGYTRIIEEAGLYLESAAAEIVQNDLDNRTVMISKKVVEGIMD